MKPALSPARWVKARGVPRADTITVCIGAVMPAEAIEACAVLNGQSASYIRQSTIVRLSLLDRLRVLFTGRLGVVTTVIYEAEALTIGIFSWPNT